MAAEPPSIDGGYFGNNLAVCGASTFTVDVRRMNRRSTKEAKRLKPR